MNEIVRKVVEAARVWAAARERFQQVSDSKKATEALIQQERKKFVVAASRLASVMAEFETALAKAPKKKRKANWTSIFKTVGAGARMLEEILAPPETPRPIRARVIDTTGEEVK